MPSLGILRSALVFTRILPVLVIVVLSAPAWIAWPFLPEPRQRIVLEMVKELAAWTRGDSGSAGGHEGARLINPDTHTTRDDRPVPGG